MKKGFTLIELLAVIVILAIIALIAVPIIVNIINDSKTSSDEQTVELYLDTAVKTITKKQLSNSNFNPDICRIQSNGDLDCYNDNNKLETLKVDIEGEHPEKGTIELKDNKFIYKNILLNGKYYYERGILVDDADNNNKISIGDKYTYKVNDTDTFNFYVLSFNDDDTVNLIMDRNICENGTVDYANDPNNNYCKYAWYAPTYSNRSGPVTAMQVLYNATKDWKNVPDMDLSGDKKYNDEGHILNSNYGYGSLETIANGIKITAKDGQEIKRDANKTPVIPYDGGKVLKSRMPREDEVTNEKTKCGETIGSCEAFLVDNLPYVNTKGWYGITIDKYSINKNNGISNIDGYWLISSYTIAQYNNGDNAAYISKAGEERYNNTHNYLQYGIRPVITVPIYDLAS